MVPLPLPHGAPRSARGAIELYEGHLATTRSIEHTPRQPRSYDSPTSTGTGTVSALYILLGVLISLCITAPIVAHFRRKQKKNVADYIQRAKRAAGEVETKAAEVAALQRRQDRLIQEQGDYQASQQRHETQLRDATSQLQTLQQQIRDLEQSIRDREGAVTLAERERDTAEAEVREARAEALEARQSHSATLEMVANLEREVQRMEEDLRALQRRYDHVDQESRRLMYEIASGQS
jgi:DNA repair exonuclease SbcCD ATPase subunit